MVDTMDHDHDQEEHQQQDSFEPLKQEFYHGKHLSAPVKEIEVCFDVFAFFFLTAWY